MPRAPKKISREKQGRLKDVGVMPLPKFRTLYFPSGVVTRDGVGIALKPNGDITLAALGRFHRTAIFLSDKERAEKLESLEKKERREMGFKLVDRSALPAPVKGIAAATSPKVAITEGGRVVFNSFINKAWQGIEKIVVLHDAEAHKVLFAALKKGEKFPVKGYDEKNAFIPSIAKANAKGKGAGDVTLPASSFLKTIGYDYAESGNQLFEAEWSDKLKGYVMTLPANGKLPKRPTTPRKPKAEVKAAIAPNGAVAGTPAPAPPADAPAADELVLE